MEPAKAQHATSLNQEPIEAICSGTMPGRDAVEVPCFKQGRMSKAEEQDYQPLSRCKTTSAAL